MPHIELDPALPGLTALMRYRPDTGGLIGALAELLLHGPSTLTRGERELIGAYVSRLNGCDFCADAHTAIATAELAGDGAAARQVCDLGPAADVPPRFAALLAIARAVTASGAAVTADLVAAAREAGADDRAIHDTVLVASLFCMVNRYVDGLATNLPDDPADYAEMAAAIVAHGYRGAPPDAESPGAVPPSKGRRTNDDVE